MTEEILEIVCGHYQINRMEIDNKSRRRDKRHIVEARQMAAYMLWTFTRLTGAQIAGILGYANKTNVAHARKTVEEISKGDRVVKEAIETIESLIKRK